MLGITKKSIALAKKINDELGNMPAKEFYKDLDSDYIKKSAEQGKKLFYSNGLNTNLGITKKSIALSKKINNELGNLPEDEMNRYLKSDRVKKAVEQGKDMFYQF